MHEKQEQITQKNTMGRAQRFNRYTGVFANALCCTL